MSKAELERNKDILKRFFFLLLRKNEQKLVEGHR